jgi:hypothetical protein
MPSDVVTNDAEFLLQPVRRWNVSCLPLQPVIQRLFDLGHVAYDINDTVRVQRDRINPRFNQEPCILWIVRRGFTTDSNVLACLVGAINQINDHALDGVVALVEEVSQLERVAVNAQHQLGQVITADRESIEPVANSLARITFEGISAIT